MTTFQIIGLIIVALLGLYVFYCIYDLGRRQKTEDRRQKAKGRRQKALLLIAAMAVGTSALAQTFDIQATYYSSTHKTLFTITRSGSSLPQQTINYRTVNLSAYAGIHYAAVSDTYTFPENSTTLQVEVTESNQYSTAYAYHYQTGTIRSYRFEVLDVNGFELASYKRDMTTGVQFSTSYLNNSVTDLVYFTDGGSIMSGSGNKYLDVSYDSPNWIQVDDDGYDQGVHTVSTNTLYNSNSTLRTILTSLSYKMYATVYFTQMEEKDGYQYIQIYTGNAGTYDNVDDPDGGVGTLTNSLYRACFILSYSPSGSVMSDPHYQFFPHRYNYVDKAAEIAANITHYEFDYDNSHLYQQKFKSNSYNSSTSGSLVLSPSAENINIRFDAGGGGNDKDQWDFKDLKVRLALVDDTYPTLINMAGITVSAGPYVKGNTFYISVPFSEIVNTANYSNNKKLVTSWGDAIYCHGDGTNVITFKGTINANAGTTLAITSLQCNFKDLTGTLYQGLGSSNYTDSFDKTFNGVTCTESYTLAATNTEFTGLQSEYVVSNTAIEPHPTVYFYKGKKENANKVQLTENTNYTLSWNNNNAAGNGRVTATGTGIYTGSASATFPIRWSTYNVSFHGNGSIGIPVTGTMSDQAFEYGVAQNLTANAFSREGFTFAGWNTLSDGSGTAYTDGQSVQGLTTEDGGTVDLYARWTVIPWTGSGDSENDPYMIIYASQLDLLAQRVNSGTGDNNASSGYSGKFFQLGSNITYGHTTAWNDATSTENNYTAIGITSEHKFKGTFDGNNHIVSGIRICNTDDYQGLFGYTNIATIKNLILSDACIKGSSYIGGIAGRINSNNTIQNCLVRNAAITGNTHVGAVVGYKHSANDYLIHNYYLGCIVKKGSTTYYTGIGLGDPMGDYPDEVASLHTLNLGDNITASGESVVIDNVTYYAHLSTITLGYTGTVNAGYNVNYQYNDGTAHAVVGNTFEMPASDVTVSSIFTDVWGIAGGATGSETHPYIISDTTGLNVLAKCVNGTHGYTANNFSGKFFKLGNNITYTYTTAWNNDSSTENNYIAIGNDSYRFQGTFDGESKIVSGIRIYKPNSENQGLFGYVDSGTVKNLTLSDVRITGGKYTGVIVGQSSKGTNENCHVVNNVAIHSTNGSDYHGGIAGLAYNYSTVLGCTSEASLTNVNATANDYGGIVGYMASGTVKDCLFTGTIPNVQTYGAIAGSVYENSSYLTNNYYTTDGIGGVNGSDCDGARRARVITLGDNVGIAGDQTAYDVSGLTAMGLTALSYNDGNSTTVYSGATQDVTLSDAAPQGYAVASYSVNGTPLAGNTFTMPDSDVTVSATIGVPYIDADGNEQICTSYTLVESSTGSTVTLGSNGTETWYAVSGNVNITYANEEAISTYGTVHLILMDGATLTVEGRYPIFTSGSLSIYGQSLGTGSLTASGSGTAIYVYDGTLTFNGGIITAISSNSHDIIYADNDITINGGRVSVNGGGINAIGTLTLGWRNATDRIYASSYDGDNGVVVKSGQYLSDGTAVYSGSLSDTQIYALAAQTLQPAVALTLPKYIDATSGVLAQEGRTAFVLPGTNVTIAAEGCTLTDVTVGGEAATDNGDGTWSFIMPATDATVSATVTVIDFTTGHAGTEDDPYIIMYRSQLDLLATRVNSGTSYNGKFIKLGADIAYDPNDLDDNGENYTAIGTGVNYKLFKGTFDGDGHIISGIRINKTGDTNADKKQGLFGYVAEASIKNVVLSDASITGYTQVGGIVGEFSFSATIQNCFVLNSHIIATDINTTHRGAIAGHYNSNLTLIDNYYYNCTVNGVSTNVSVGGSSVSDRDGARGVNKLTLCNHVIATPAAAVTYQGNSYYVAGTSVTLSVEEGYTLNGSYTVKDADNNDVALTGGDTFEMPASDVTVSADITLTTMDGSGTENDPWIIMYRSQMDQLAISEINNGQYYQLGRDLTYSYEGLGETESNYTPIRVNEGGHFDGAGHTISGIRIYPHNDHDDDNKGLFFLNHGTVKNVTLTDAIITGKFYIGGIAGDNEDNGIIENCHVTSTVIIKAYGYLSDYHGGIAGINSGDVGKMPAIRNCTSAAILTNNGYENCGDYGGIVGENIGGIVSGCMAYGASVTATGAAGGIVGYNYCCCGYESPVVENCFAIGCTINSGSAGAITGPDNHAIFDHNYYYNCTANGNTTDIGCNHGDIIEETNFSGTYYDGAVQVFSLTLGEHITATPTAAYSYSDNNYYTAGTSVTLSPEEGYAISGGYTVNGVQLLGDTFTMPASDVTVSATTVELIAFKLFDGEYLAEGDYLIVYEWRAMNNEVSRDEFQFESVDVDDDVISTSDANIIWHIAHNNDHDYWTIYNAAAGKYARAKDSGGGVCLHDSDCYETWWSFADAPGDGAYYIKNQSMSNSDHSNSYLKFLAQGFSCHEINMGNTPSLYRKVETFTKDIKGYTDDESGWYLIASPLDDYVEVNNVEHMQDNTFDLYRFNQDASAEWENWKAEGDHYHYDLVSGTGYLYANSEDVTLTFTGWPYSGNGKVMLYKTQGVSFEGWNLVGNPWSVEATINKDFYRMNDDGSEIIAATDNTVDAMEGIFVHTDQGGEEMTFTPNSNSTKGRSQSHEPEQIVINLSPLNSHLSTSIIDCAIVRFDGESTMTKLQIFDGSTKLYIPQNGKEYAIISADGRSEIPVNFKAKENGEFTLTVSAPLNSKLSTLNLIDNLTGANIDLLKTPSYTFTAKTTDYASRFKLVFANENDTENEDFAFISNGEIIVNGEGTLQVIDVLGHLLVSRQVTSDFRLLTSDFSPGVYVLRLINGENVKTQKIVIR